MVEPESENSLVRCVSFAEWRQRNMTGPVAKKPGEEATITSESSTGHRKPESNGSVPKLVKDWSRVMAERIQGW